MTPVPDTLGVILAGGLARRMGGGDKPLLMLAGQPLLTHLAHRLRPQCESIILNANGDVSRFAGMGLPVVPDPVPDHPGPLAGLLAAMDWAIENKPSIDWIISVPGDTPFIPMDLVARLHAARNSSGNAIVCAASGAWRHYTTGLWPVSLRDDLHRAVTLEGVRRVEDWAKRHGLTAVSWPEEPIDPFFNINTPGDLDAANVMLSREQPGSRRLGERPREQERRDD